MREINRTPQATLFEVFPTRKVLLLFALMQAAAWPASAGTCSTPPLAIRAEISADQQLRFIFQYMESCDDIYQLRSGIAGGSQQQSEFRGRFCNNCAIRIGANLDKPYRFIIQGCITHPLGPSQCTPWSNTVYYLPYGPDTCIDGYVWREANSSDHVCVSPPTRAQAWQDNDAAPSRVSPTDHTYGPDTCIQGFVWREAFPNDHVCVTLETRQQAWDDNSVVASRFARNN